MEVAKLFSMCMWWSKCDALHQKTSNTHIFQKGFCCIYFGREYTRGRRRGKRGVIDGPYLDLHTNKLCQKGSYNLTALLYFALQAAMIFMLVQNFYPLNMHLWPILCIYKVKDIPQSRSNENRKFIWYKNFCVVTSISLYLYSPQNVITTTSIRFSC